IGELIEVLSELAESEDYDPASPVYLVSCAGNFGDNWYSVLHGASWACCCPDCSVWRRACRAGATGERDGSAGCAACADCAGLHRGHVEPAGGADGRGVATDGGRGARAVRRAGAGRAGGRRAGRAAEGGVGGFGGGTHAAAAVGSAGEDRPVPGPAREDRAAGGRGRDR